MCRLVVEALVCSILVASLFSPILAASVRPYRQRRDMDGIRPVEELDWEVPLVSGSHALPYPASDKTLKYLTIARGFMTYECDSTIEGDEQAGYVDQKTYLYDVAPLAGHLPDEEALHALVPRFCDYDYSQLSNTTIGCVGRIFSQFGHSVVDLFGYGVPEFSVELTWAIPSPTDPANNGFWAHSATFDNEWEVYRVETAGGAAPESCRGHENSTIDVVYAAEYWFYHE